MKLFRKIIAVLCSIAISFSVIVPSATAVSVGEAIAGAGVVVDFFGLAADMYDRWKAANPDTPDSEYPGFHPGGEFGGGAVRPRPEEFEAAYDEYVGTLPATGYNSAGKLIWQPGISDVVPGGEDIAVLYRSNWVKCKVSDIPFTYQDGNLTCELSYYTSSSGLPGFRFSYRNAKLYCIPRFYVTVPVAGSYCMLKSPKFAYSGTSTSGGNLSDTGYYSQGSYRSYASGSTIYVSSGNVGRDLLVSSGYIDVYFPLYEVVPDTAPSADAYSTTTRPTSITGGNYGIVGDNNEITKVEDNSTIVNETNNTYYNPATGTTVPITNWSYDYSDRSYKVTMESGDTATITYGDENISITETNTTSGDTVTNNYTIYYLVDAPDQSACTHNWTETSTIPATCTVPGSRLLTCSLCSLTKTESIPVLGHDWEVKKTVTTQYDETGQLTQQGYTVFECGTCHEQYKSEDGVLPPAVTPGSGTDLAAVDALKEKLQIAADALLGIFHKLPELFTGFTDFLAAVFPFVPTEFITIFELGLFLLIAAAALRKFLS